MKLSRLFLCVALFTISFSASAAWDIYKTGLSINGGYYDCQMNTAAPDFQNNYFGRYTTSGSLILNFSELLTYKNGASNACGGNLRYRVYRTSDTPGAFATLALTFCCNQGGTDCGGGACGPDVNNPGDQKWKGNSGANLLTSLTLSGTYVIEVYYDATGDDAGGCTNTKYSSNGGVNYRAYFEFEMNDNFTDLDFATPTWSGDVGAYTVIANSNTSGLTGSEPNRTHTVRLNAAGADISSISTQIATWDQQQEWYFWLGRNGNGGAPQDFDANNRQAVYLYSSTSNLESATCNGYRILIGENTTSYVRLQRIDAGVATTIFTSATGIPNGLTDFGISFMVTRSQLGVWTILTSVLPTNGANTQSTPTPNSAPEILSTVNHGSATDNTYAPAANGYFGFQAIHDASSEGIQAAEFDNFRFRALPPNTYVAISGATSGSVNEDAVVAGNIAIGVDIFNASGVSATTVQLVLTSGAAIRAGGGLLAATAYAPSYTTQTLTWGAGTSGTKYFYIDPADNALCDDIATLVLQLQNVSGGTNAFIAAANTYTLSIVDDNMGYETLLSDNFNSGSITSWVATGTSWSANNSSPIEGSHSARHSTQGASSTSSLTHPIDEASLIGVNTNWRFEVSFPTDATANNNFAVFLSSSENNLSSATNNGYAVVIDQSSLPTAGTLDYIRLYRVTNGVYATTPIVSSTTDWVNNVNGGLRVGFEVSLNDAGTWNLKVDADGGFDALASLGTGVDNVGGSLTFPTVKGFGMRFKYLPAASDFMRFDNVSITQSGCKELWYSQGTGNSNAAMWNAAPVGTPAVIVSGRYDRFVIQSGHNITVNGNWISQSIAIEPSGTLTGGSGTLVVYENFVNSGTFVGGTSTVTFKGQIAQSILGSSQTTFRNLKIDNDGFNVTLLTVSFVTGLVQMEEGTLQTGGILTLISNSSGSASISEIKAGAAVSGNVILQRYMPAINNVYGNWINLGCPIVGQTVNDWKDDITLTGFAGSHYPSYQFNNVQYYDESVAGTMNVGYVGATNVTNALLNNRGYFVWLQGAAQNLDNTGTIQSGPITHALSYTITSPGGIFDYGWNLMPNPYPSEVDWNLVSSTLTGPKVYYVFDHESNAYKYRNATTNSGTASRYIAHSQAFLVKVNNGTQSLAYQESYKTNTGAAMERSDESTNSFVALQLSRNGMTDESILMFATDATDAYDGYDVYDLESPNSDAVEFSLMSVDNVGLAQDVRPFDNNIHIPVRVDLPTAGIYTFSVSETQNMPFGSCLYVEDIVTGNVMDLIAGASFTITTYEPYSGNRLIIHGTAPVTTVMTEPACYGGTDGSLDITTPTVSWSVSLTGDTDNYQYVSGGSITFDHLSAGTYQLEVNNAISTCGSQATTIVISEPTEISSVIADMAIVPCNEGQSGQIEWTVNNANWFSYEVRNALNEVVRNGEVEGSIGFAEELPAGLYTINIYTTCSSETLTADLRDPSAAMMTVTVPAVSVIENGSAVVNLSADAALNADIQWTLSNGLVLSGAIVTANIQNAGDYSYQVTATGNCVQTESGTFTVALTSSVKENAIGNAVRILQSLNNIQLTFNQTLGDNALIKMYDAQGREVMSKRTVAHVGQNVNMETTQLSAGIYSIQVITAGTKVFTAQVYKR